MLGGLLLILLVAGFLVAGGVTMVLVSWRPRRIYRAGGQAGNAWTRFMIRF